MLFVRCSMAVMVALNTGPSSCALTSSLAAVVVAVVVAVVEGTMGKVLSRTASKDGEGFIAKTSLLLRYMVASMRRSTKECCLWRIVGGA